MAISVDTLQRKMAEPVILADCFYQVICRRFAKWLHPRRNLRPAPPQWLRMAPRRTAVSAAMFAPCVGDVLRDAARRPTKNSAPPRQKISIQSGFFFDAMDLGVEKNEGGLAEKIPSSYQTKKFQPSKT
jgi:hypothetical protein